MSSDESEAPVGPSAELVLVEQGVRYKLQKETTQIGRLPSCDIPLKDHSVSRVHAEVRRSTKGYLLQDMSHNGSLVNGQKVKRVLLQDGDELQFGKKTLTFYLRESGVTRRVSRYERKVGKNLSLLKDLYDEVSRS